VCATWSVTSLALQFAVTERRVRLGTAAVTRFEYRQHATFVVTSDARIGAFAAVLRLRGRRRGRRLLCRGKRRP
jgi:hypothetical protein